MQTFELSLIRLLSKIEFYNFKLLNILFEIGGYSAKITLNRHTYTRQNQYVKITSGLILEKCQRQIFVATATYEFVQKNDSDNFLRWFGDKDTQKDATRRQDYPSWKVSVICMSLCEVDTSVTCDVFMHRFGSFLLQVMLVSLQRLFCYHGTKYESNCEDVVYQHSTL